MNKICTSLEQSKKLIELGIDANTADMFYAKISIDGDIKYNLHPLESYDFKTFSDTKLKESKHLSFIPAWSLTALSNFILSSIMDDNGNIYKFYLSKDGINRWIAYYKSDNVSIHICEESYNMIDVILEMVCWLEENEKI